jgi:antitoxin PrlF
MQRTASVTSKGQVTIPIEVRRLLGLAPQDKVTFRWDDGTVTLHAERLSVTERTKGIIKTDVPPLSPQEEKRLAEEAIAEEAAARGLR